jgi:hypothetical protein
MGDPEVLSAQIDSESDLWENFTEYRDPGESKSSTTRQLLRSGLEREGYMESPRDDQPEPTGFAVAAYDLATTTFQVSATGVAAAALAFLFVPGLFEQVSLFTAGAAVTSILSTLTAAAAARVDSSVVQVRERVLGMDSDEDDKPTADPRTGD